VLCALMRRRASWSKASNAAMSDAKSSRCRCRDGVALECLAGAVEGRAGSAPDPGARRGASAASGRTAWSQTSPLLSLCTALLYPGVNAQGSQDERSAKRGMAMAARKR